MNTAYWHRQTADAPLFPEIDWSRPETKRRGGKLLIVGGHQQSFRKVAEAYEVAHSNSVGSVKIAVPDALEPVMSQLLPEAEYLTSNASGGIGLAAKDALLAYSEWADGVLLAGDLGRNSETPQVLDAFIHRYAGLLTLTADAADATIFSYSSLIDRENTLLVVSLAQLQNLFKELAQPAAITSSMGLVKLAELLHAFTSEHEIALTTFFEKKLISTMYGEVVTTPYAWGPDDPSWRVPVAAKQAAHLMQHAETPFKALAAAHLNT